MQLYCSIVSAPLRGITFLNNEKQRNGTCYSRVSVPLWGITFLNQIPCDTKMTHHVSIPLQGITFLNRTGARQRTGVRQVSVPLRGITFLNRVTHNGRQIAEMVSVPLRGITFLNSFREPFGHIEYMFPSLILSRLVDTFFSRISLTMPPAPKSHNTAYVLPWEEPLHWQSRSSGYSSS